MTVITGLEYVMSSVLWLRFLLNLNPFSPGIVLFLADFTRKLQLQLYQDVTATCFTYSFAAQIMH